jgi:hypothetical protein
MLRHVANIPPLFLGREVTMLSEFRIDRIEIWILFDHAVPLCNLMYTEIMTSHSKCALLRSECVHVLYVYVRF